MKNKQLKKSRLGAGFTVPLLLIVLLIIVGLNSMEKIQAHMKNIVEDNNVKTTLVTEMRYAARERTIILYRVIMLTDPFEKDEEFLRFNHLGARFANARIKLMQMSLSPLEKIILKKQGEYTVSTVDNQRLNLSLALDDRIEEATQLLFEKTYPEQQKVFDQLSRLLVVQEEATKQALNDADAAYRQTRTIMIIMGSSALLLVFIVAIIVVKRANEAEAKLLLEKTRAQVTLHSIGEGVITTDADGFIKYLNPVAEQMTGCSMEDAKDLPLLDVFKVQSENEQDASINPINKAIAESRIVSGSNNTIFNRQEKRQYAIEYTAGPIRDEGDILHGAVLVFRNITDIRDMAQQMSYQATHDALTGLINRVEFENRLEFALKTARDKQEYHVLCYMDLDQFKVVNDTCGHRAGDELLKQLVKLFAERLRSGDTFARLGGDEFGLLLTNCELENALKVSNDFRNLIRDFRFYWDDKSFAIGVSIGLVAITAESGTITDLLSAADSACYVAKDLGRDRLHVYEPDDKALAERQGEMQWLPRIRQATEENRITLYGQQIVNLQDPLNDTMHYEILVRMLDENDLIIPPMAFIPAAERYHLMPAVDRCVIRNAIELIEYQQARRPDMKMSWAINLSGQSLCEDTFLDFIWEQISSSKINPSCICFEVTETAAVTNLSRATEFITSLRSRGCRFALDDFGSGLSSFNYLKNLPVDYLKIDGSFVKDMLDDPIDMAMVESINQIGHTMGLQTIAEFVESKSIEKKLAELGIDYAQGFGVHKPQPLEEIINHKNSKAG